MCAATFLSFRFPGSKQLLVGYRCQWDNGLFVPGPFSQAAAAPFFFAGIVIGMLLTFNAGEVNKVYGFDLLGAGLGCLLCPLFLWQTGAGGCVVLVMLLALTAVVISVPPKYRRVMNVVGIALGVIGLSYLPVLDNQFPVPSKNMIFITGKIGIEFQKSIIDSRWSATSRVDLVNLGKRQWFVVGLGDHSSKGAIVPEEKWIMQDGSAGTCIINFSQYPFALETLRRSLYSTAYILKEKPRVEEYDMEHSVACIGYGAMRTVLVKKGPFTTDEIARLENFCEKWGFSFIYHPFKQLGNPVETFVRVKDKAFYIDEFPRDISPTSDAPPYFFNFSKWGGTPTLLHGQSFSLVQAVSQKLVFFAHFLDVLVKWSRLFSSAKHIHEPTAISQGNPILFSCSFW
jgi:hypothetical protein